MKNYFDRGKNPHSSFLGIAILEQQTDDPFVESTSVELGSKTELPHDLKSTR